jgi:uncharacterized protein with von Willebrand factor type A (vWA) domain
MRSSDLGAELSGFAAVLRTAGVPADTARVIAAQDALTRFSAAERHGIYWATRLTFCSRRSHIPLFNAAYAAWFGAPPPTDASTDVESVDAVPAAEGDGAGDATGTVMSEMAGGTADSLALRDVTRLNEAERIQVQAFVARLLRTTDDRPLLREAPDRRGRVDIERTTRLMLRSGGEPSRMLYRDRIVQRRPLLILVDVSESMRGYWELLLRFGHAAVQAGPDTTEVFTLGTRVVRVTRALRVADPDLAARATARLECGWGGGTKLGPGLLAFLRRWGGHCAVRAATVVVASDGWEHGPPDMLEQQVRRLKLRSHRLIWVNPQLGAPRFRPRAAGLRRVLPLVDAHLAGHSFAALEALADTITHP